MRIEHDSMGELAVPDDALYGASTQRAVLNFPISGRPLPAPFIRALGLVKLAAARANEELGLLAPDKSLLIQQAAREIADGLLLEHFPIDVFQTGSGTSTNMNANEVIANRAQQLAGAAPPAPRILHPNDDVNLCQSSNDVIPSALNVSVALALATRLAPALDRMASALARKSADFRDIVTIGRTHLMDATPVSLGQVFSGYAAQVAKAAARARRAAGPLAELALGGTAVGTGINCHPGFAALACRALSDETGFAFREAPNHFEAQGARDDAVDAAGALAAIASALGKIANDIRLLGSGPRAGLAELALPATQPGSSIMPGKVNPVMCEMLVQVGLYVHGLTQTVTLCGRDGQFELNATLPLIAHALHEAIHVLANGAQVFTERCVVGLEADAARCRDLVERSLMLITALTPHLGYDVAAQIAKEALASGRNLREVVLERGLMDAATLERALDPRRMLAPSTDKAARTGKQGKQEQTGVGPT